MVRALGRVRGTSGQASRRQVERQQAYARSVRALVGGPTFCADRKLSRIRRRVLPRCPRVRGVAAVIRGPRGALGSGRPECPGIRIRRLYVQLGETRQQRAPASEQQESSNADRQSDAWWQASRAMRRGGHEGAMQQAARRLVHDAEMVSMLGRATPAAHACRPVHHRASELGNEGSGARHALDVADRRSFAARRSPARVGARGRAGPTAKCPSQSGSIRQAYAPSNLVCGQPVLRCVERVVPPNRVEHLTIRRLQRAQSALERARLEIELCGDGLQAVLVGLEPACNRTPDFGDESFAVELMIEDAARASSQDRLTIRVPPRKLDIEINGGKDQSDLTRRETDGRTEEGLELPSVLRLRMLEEHLGRG